MSAAKSRVVQLQALDGWRGITALLVVFFHLNAAHSLFMHEWLRYLAPVLEFFFIVSGFVMALGFSEKVKDWPTFWSFVIRRAGRVWPLHLAMLGLLLLIPLLRFVLETPGPLFSGRLSLEALPYQLLIIQTWWPQYAFTWNYPAWTLTGELLAYLLMAMILVFSKSRRMRWLLTLPVLIIAFGDYYLAMPDDLSSHNPLTYNTVTVSRAVTGFFIGFLLYHVWIHYPLRHLGLANALEISTLIGFIALLNTHPIGLAYFLNHALFALLIYVYASDLGIISRMLKHPALQWLGTRSFSIYMFHGVVTTWLMLIVYAIDERVKTPITSVIVAPGEISVRVVMLPQQWMNDALALTYLLVVVLGATYIYRWIENPSRIYFAKLSTRRLKSPDRVRSTSFSNPRTE